jgi:hypothetical protein
LGTILIRCPRTGIEVSTGIDLDRRSWDALPVVTSTFRCAACGAEHVWSKTYARFAASEARPDPRG